MNCPVCGSNEHVDIDLQSESFYEGIRECTVCDSVYAVNHNVANIVMDTQEESFLGNASRLSYSFAA
jgi:transcription elongation factor Elf1